MSAIKCLRSQAWPAPALLRGLRMVGLLRSGGVDAVVRPFLGEGLEPGLKLFQRQRPAEQKALVQIAAVGIQKAKLFFAFDAFGQAFDARFSAMPMMVWMMTASFWVTPRLCTKERSIFNWSNGSLVR